MMTLMMMIPMFLVPQEEVDKKQVDLTGVKLYVYDADQGLTFKIAKDGKVTLALPGRKTFEAPSLEEFRRKHPDLIAKHRLGRYLPVPAAPPGGIEELWEKFKKQRPEDWNPFGEGWDEWLEDQRNLFNELRKRFGEPGLRPVPAPEPAPSGPTFGIRVEGVGETLRDQLSLAEGHGVLVSEVTPGSLAEKAGVKRHDVILTLDGKDVTGTWAFRRNVAKALAGQGFSLGIMRGGKKQTLEVKTGR